MNQTDVLIVGAGPTGLVLALWLVKQVGAEERG
jgi:2-polyprenyl-6-methoxyphenol hydroxylase-like FAD-dependent oxidoreductase